MGARAQTPYTSYVSNGIYGEIEERKRETRTHLISRSVSEFCLRSVQFLFIFFFLFSFLSYQIYNLGRTTVANHGHYSSERAKRVLFLKIAHTLISYVSAVSFILMLQIKEKKHRQRKKLKPKKFRVDLFVFFYRRGMFTIK